MTTRDDKKVALPKPWQSRTVMSPDLYTAAQLESYAAARVAEATDELQRRVAELEAFAIAMHSAEQRYGAGFYNDEAWDSAYRGIVNSILADREGGKA